MWPHYVIAPREAQGNDHSIAYPAEQGMYHDSTRKTLEKRRFCITGRRCLFRIVSGAVHRRNPTV